MTTQAPSADTLHRLERLQRLRELKLQEAGSAVAAAPLQPKQQQAEDLAGQADELLFGGAAGGGKTHWLISHAARQCTQHPGNRVVIFRRVFPSLARSVIPRARAMLAGRARYNDARHVFEFSNGSVLELASLQYARTA